MIKKNGATIFAYFEFNCYGENTFFAIVKCYVSATFMCIFILSFLLAFYWIGTIIVRMN